ncbi:isopentenyl phosphate kinase [Natronobacterium gregoryi]|uniref:Isopentenyl phosphate kinase n=2 Tax=Natronobacterium gregoryi TaxID=44930 RepID=L0AIU9_NATGS|nr:isopentenyl phosphate kinase [Natronobacterium gregoryi]AFZ73721.1 putative archaeal kinase [Natronobacterium gregoryi SP2]ELY67681.1 aspartate/glutamate/uridylate kinase [Natronobacterium gregoryi SP2]PLK19588.1 acetylglutamate kinase [Natronobacterium gregoryi SP2]SFJ01963.1 isopentenyl phosphate kinase [Natronobacterium gregoryi]
MIVLKLGGSVITEKDRPETLDGEALERAADAIAGARGGGWTDLVVVHGGGSFGHHNASEHGITTTDGTHDVGALLDVHGAMTTLNRFVLRRLFGRNVDAVPVHPFSMAARDGDGDLELPIDGIRTMLEEGFVPILHGDLVPHAGAGATVVSGDELVAELARELGADRVGLCSTVPGVLDDGDAVIEEIETFDDAADVLGESEATDVTGGMAGKVQALLELEADAEIFGLDELDAFLEGTEPGTTIK